jgi:hypothetical protein
MAVGSLSASNEPSSVTKIISDSESGPDIHESQPFHPFQILWHVNKGHHYDFTASGNPYKLVIQLFEFQFQPSHVVRAAPVLQQTAWFGSGKHFVGRPQCISVVWSLYI